MSRLLKDLGVAAKGFAMGAANVIPGVSGGTIALLTGIFNELIGALNAILTPKAWKLLFKGSFREFWEYIHGKFLLWLAVGVLASVFSLAKLMEYVLGHHPVQTWAFFFGLILVSAVYMLADLKGKKAVDLVWLAVGAALGAAICLLSPSSTPDAPWFIAVCGAIAICTMILPGISGSFILVLLGKYDYIMGAVSNLDIPVLLMFAVGCVVGIVAFSKILHWLIDHFEKQTLLVLIGFTLGSLVKVWPWADKEAYEAANILAGCPAGELHVLSAVICAVLAGAVVIVLEVLAHRRK
ncbi:MAG: DUF368 domain-containing protein [Candidatus Cryptobacteroides sp.]